MITFCSRKMPTEPLQMVLDSDHLQSAESVSSSMPLFPANTPIKVLQLRGMASTAEYHVLTPAISNPPFLVHAEPGGHDRERRKQSTKSVLHGEQLPFSADAASSRT